MAEAVAATTAAIFQTEMREVNTGTAISGASAATGTATGGGGTKAAGGDVSRGADTPAFGVVSIWGRGRAASRGGSRGIRADAGTGGGVACPACATGRRTGRETCLSPQASPATIVEGTGPGVVSPVA